MCGRVIPLGRSCLSSVRHSCCLRWTGRVARMLGRIRMLRCHLRWVAHFWLPLVFMVSPCLQNHETGCCFVIYPTGGLLTNRITEWKGRSDGLVAHIFFKRNANFALSVFAFAVEGWIFYSAVNSVVPQIVLNLGFETDSWDIAVRQQSYGMLSLAASIPVTWYATVKKDMKTPLLITFGLFLIV